MDVIMTAQGGNVIQLRQSVTTMVTLTPGEVYRLPEHCAKFYVISGTAWLTDAGGNDRILWSGESTDFLPTRLATVLKPAVPALVSSLGDMPLRLEFSGSAL